MKVRYIRPVTTIITALNYSLHFLYHAWEQGYWVVNIVDLIYHTYAEQSHPLK